MDVNLSKLPEIVKDREAWCCSPWGCKESDMMEELNNNSLTLETSCLAGGTSKLVAPGPSSCNHAQAVFQGLTLTCYAVLGKPPSLSGPPARYSILEPLLQARLSFCIPCFMLYVLREQEGERRERIQGLPYWSSH